MNVSRFSPRMFVLSAFLAIINLTQTFGADSPSAREALDKLLPELPSMVWHANGASQRERGRPSMLPDHDEFVETYRAEVESIREDDAKKPNWVRIRMHDPSDAEIQWVFEFKHNGTQWQPATAAIYREGEKVADKYENSLFSPSMRPQMEKALVAFWAGEDFRRQLGLRAAVEAKLDQIAEQAAPESARLRLTKDAWLKRKQASANPPASRGKVYRVASPATIAGAGFVLKWKDKPLAVTAAHAHPDKPGHLVDIETDKDVNLGKEIRQADDIRLLEVQGTDLPSFTPIDPSRRLLLAEDELVVITHDGPVEGILESANMGLDDMKLPGEPVANQLTMRARGKVNFQGNSGAPVLLKDTGEVIGILVTAREADRETVVGFELLDLTSLETQSDPAAVTIPTRFFGAEVKEEGRGKLAEEAVRRFLPAEFLDYTSGMSPLPLLKRPYLPGTLDHGPHGIEAREYLGKQYLFHRAIFVLTGRSVNLIRLESARTERPADDFEQAPEWLLSAFGAPSKVFVTPLLPVIGGLPDGEQTQAGSGLIACAWNTPACTVLLSFWSVREKEPAAELIIAPPNTDPSEYINTRGAEWLEPTVETVRQRVKDWAREIAKLPAKAEPAQ